MKLAVIGAGSWGITLTWLLSNNFDNVALWGRNIKAPEHFLQTQLPSEIQFKQNVEITSNIENAVKDADIILLVVATCGIRDVCQQLKKLNISENQILVNASKGIELSTLNRMSEVIAQELPFHKIVTLSGPNLAKEIAKGLPTAAVAAHEDIKVAEFVRDKFNVSGKFRLYANTDVAGVELGGSLKNVIAIASGFVDAMNLGYNARGAILTRGLAEIVRISVTLGANPSTLYGLSGIGDLIATCSSPLSRNYQVGYSLGQGKKLDKILSELGAVAEGVKTTKAICDLAKKLNIEAPVSNVIYEAIYTEISPLEVIDKLMNRQLKSEDSYQFLIQ